MMFMSCFLENKTFGIRTVFLTMCWLFSLSFVQTIPRDSERHTRDVEGEV